MWLCPYLAVENIRNLIYSRFNYMNMDCIAVMDQVFQKMVWNKYMFFKICTYSDQIYSKDNIL